MPEVRRIFYGRTASKYFGWFKAKPDVEHSLPEAELPTAEREEAMKHLKQAEEAEKNDEQRT